MIMQKTDYEVPEEDGMMIKFSFPTVSLLDFQKGKELMDIGYKTYPFHDRLHQATGSPGSAFK